MSEKADPCSIADALHGTPEHHAWHGISRHPHLSPHRNMGHLRLPEIGYHPQVGVINYIDQRLSRLHQLSFVDLLLAHHADRPWP